MPLTQLAEFYLNFGKFSKEIHSQTRQPTMNNFYSDFFSFCNNLADCSSVLYTWHVVQNKQKHISQTHCSRGWCDSSFPKVLKIFCRKHIAPKSSRLPKFHPRFCVFVADSILLQTTVVRRGDREHLMQYLSKKSWLEWRNITQWSSVLDWIIKSTL